MPFIGEIAGLLTSLCFTANSLIVTRAGQQVGSVIVNRTRVLFALGYLVFLNTLLYQQPLPFTAGAEHWFWLSLSGVIGLALGDAFLFQAYLTIGPRLGMLLLSLSTVIGAVEAWVFFGESLHLAQMIGIALTLAGIVWVVSERGNNANRKIPGSITGIIFGILAAFGQGTGLVLSRQGMSGGFPPLSGNVIRMLAACLALWLFALLQKQAVGTIQLLRSNPSLLKLLALAALIGPVIGVSLSLLAVQNTAVGVASVLTSLAPVFMLPFSHFFLHERLNWQVVAGTGLAMIGVVVLFQA